MTTALLWVRRDLRLHDNEALSRAAAADRLLPVYVVDPRTYGSQPYGGRHSFDFEKTGGFRTRFRLESVRAFRDSLRERGSELLVRVGRPEDVLPALASAVEARVVSMQTEPAPEERAVENRVVTALRRLDAAPQVRRAWGHTLYHVDDLPTPYTAIDDTYTPFRKAVESASTVRDQQPTPTLPPLPATVDDGDRPPGEIPSVRDLVGESAPGTDDRAVLPFEGGEPRALDRVDSYLWREDRLREYRETRNGLLGAGYSAKLSPWLNEGCLSPRYVHDEVRRYEAERVANDSTYWLLFELVWRDFFQFQVAKHGGQFFSRGGIRERTDIAWRDDETALRRWQRGETGVPFVDANMRELNATGYVSNRGRQNAASFLANDLRIDWRRGAAYFETQLVDYDPCSNYGNWAYIAGVGNDSRDRAFDVLSQARRYDSDAEYVTTWLPELDGLPPRYAHEPWTLSDAEAARYGVEVGVDYPAPMVDPATLE